MATQETVDISQFTSTAESDVHAESVVQMESGVQMEEGEKTLWADDSADDVVQLPCALKQLVNNGLRFKSVSHWSETARPMLVKNLSVYFSVDTVVTSQAILEAFDSAGIEIDYITSIQRKSSNHTWVVSFDNQLAKDAALKVASVEIAGTTVFLGDCENRLILVKIYEAPAELPDTVVIGRLNHYGRVLSFRRDKIAQFIENGVRTARMSINQNIPSIINIAGEYVRVWYPNQPKTCRNCGSEDHLVKECTSVRCFNCEKSGHRLEDCEELPKCTVCKSEEHRLAECPFVLYSANVDNDPKEMSEDDKRRDKEKYKERLEKAKQKQREAEQEQAKLQMEKRKEQDARSAQGSDKGKDKGQNKDKGEDNGKGENKDKNKGGEKSVSRSESRSDDSGKQKRDKRRDETDDEKERRDRRDFEAWKEDRKRKDHEYEDRDDRHREREYSHRDYHRDRSSRRENYYSDNDDDGGWNRVSHRRKHRYDR